MRPSPIRPGEAPAQRVSPMAKLREVMEEKADFAALRYSTAEFERMAAAAELVANSSGPARSEGSDVVNMPSGNKNTEIMTLAVTLLNAGVDTKAVGQILIGSSPAVPIISPNGGPGISVDDILKVTDRLIEGKGESDKDRIILDLRDRLTRLEAGGENATPVAPLDPIAQATANAQSLKLMIDAFRQAGLIQEQPPGGREGQSLEELKEGNRHKETMEELQADREHKGDIAKVVSSLPERVGQGISKDLRARSRSGNGGGGGGRGEGGLPSFPCEICHHPIYVPPDVGDTLHCGHCGETYKPPGGAAQPAGDAGK